jgi:hypothetical protein
MTARPPAQIADEIIKGRGRGDHLRQKLVTNQARNWLLPIVLGAFERADNGTDMTDLDKEIVNGFRRHKLTDADLKTYAQISRAIPARTRAELFPGKFARLTASTKYSIADLRRDAPDIVKAVVGMPNVADVDVTAVHAGTRSLREFTTVPRDVARTHSGEMLRAVAAGTSSSTAKYTIKAVRFRCNDETGTDFLGSDEPYWIFGSLGEGTAVTTQSQVFGDVDTGESRNFSAGDGCIWGQSCQAQALPDGEIGSLVSLWEHDAGDPEKVRELVAGAFAAAAAILAATGVAAWISAVIAGVGAVVQVLLGLLDDDHLADQTFVFTRQTIEDRLAKVGSSFDVVRRFAGGSGDYTLTIRVTRAA